jgi:hypothetical protein
MKMGRFLKHGPCNKCGSRDNVAHYDDGGWFCFGCGYSLRGTRVTSSQLPATHSLALPDDLTNNLPRSNHTWLAQYLTETEIADNFSYSPSSRRHIYMVRDLSHTPIFYEARRVGELYGKPKTLSFGEKPFHLLRKNNSDDKVVLVEDIISAIKINRQFNSFPLFGTHIPISKLKRFKSLPNPLKTILIWLDRDKFKEAMKLSKVCELLGYNSRVISTEIDPKGLTDQEICDRINV